MQLKTTITMIISIIILLTTTLTATAASCADATILYTGNCTITTPTIYCSAYNYTIYNLTSGIIQKGPLELANGVYYLDFNISQDDLGCYIVELCDGARLEECIIEAGEGEKMIGTSLLLIFMVVALAALSILSDASAIKFTSGGLAVIEFVVLIGYLYAGNAGIDYSSILQINFYALFIVIGFAGLLILLLFFTGKMDTSDDKEDRWGNRWK